MRDTWLYSSIYLSVIVIDTNEMIFSDRENNNSASFVTFSLIDRIVDNGRFVDRIVNNGRQGYGYRGW